MKKSDQPTVHESEDGEDVSLFALGTLLLANRWRLAGWGLLGALLALALVFNRPALYLGSASFMPQGSDATRNGLASLAGQFGVTLSAGASAQQSPDFYSSLIRSRLLLAPIVRDTFTVPELGGKRIAFLDLFEVPGGSALYREEQGVRLLQRMVSSGVAKTTGVITVGVPTKWPSVSLRILQRLLAGINDFNQHIRQGQARAEREFVEGRLRLAEGNLRNAEDRLQQFLSGNRQAGSPSLMLTRERLERDVALQSQVYTSLRQAYEDARIREVRDIPVITVVEPPAVPSLPEPRGRAKSIVLGGLFGGFAGMLLVILSAALARRRTAGDPDVEAFLRAVGELGRGVARRQRHAAAERP